MVLVSLALAVLMATAPGLAHPMVGGFILALYTGFMLYGAYTIRHGRRCTKQGCNCAACDYY